MSADMIPGPGLDTRDAQALAEQETVIQGPEEVVSHAVDVYDAAARLESRGYGDVIARHRGYLDVFDMAITLWQQRVMAPHAVGSRLAPGLLRAALGRMLVLFGGVVISLACLPSDTSALTVFITGAVGWICGQAASAGIWRGLGIGRQPAAQAAVSSAPWLLLLSAVASVALGVLAPLLWTLWAISASVLVILRPGRVVVTFTVLGSGLAWLISAADHAAGIVAACLVILCATAGAAIVLKQAGARWQRIPAFAVAPQLMGALQALGQVVVLAVVLAMNGPDSFVAVAIAGLVAGALSDPILEMAQLAVRRVAATTLPMRVARRVAVALGLVGILLVILAAVLTAIEVRWLFAPEQELAPIVLAICLVAAVTVGAGVLLRAGTAAGAMALALAAAIACLAAEVLVVSGVYEEVLGILSILVVLSVICALRLSAWHSSRPVAW